MDAVKYKTYCILYLSLSAFCVSRVNTWHHTSESYSPLSNEISPDGIMVPHLETHQGDVWHQNVEDQCFLPHWIKA